MAITITAKEQQIIRNVSIPPRPEALLKISEEAKKPEPDVSKIAAFITQDVSISAAVLQVVNSAAFRRAKEIQSIQQAVMTLGFKRLLPLVKSVALKSAMGESDKLASFWEQASKVATACTLAAKVMDKPALQDHAYMLGLFHNAGIPVMTLENPDYESILTQAEAEGWHLVTDEERRRYGTSHTTISALLGQKWKLPAVMTEVIYYQFDLEGLYTSGELSKTGLDLMSILKIARYVVMSQDGSGGSEEWLQAEDAILAHYDLSEQDIEYYRDSILEQMTD